MVVITYNHCSFCYFFRYSLICEVSVYVGKFVTLLNHATKFKEVKIRKKVSPVLVSNGKREKRPEIRKLP